MNSIKIKANAKINLSLNITGKRSDGYHYIDTVMQSVSLFDTVTVKKADKLSLKCSLNHLSSEENLGFKAARLFFEKTKIKGGAEIYIDKNIPEAAGLGGGSADAAAVLLGLDRLFETELSFTELSQLAVTLGADVPFFLIGGTVRCTGIGEIIKKIKSIDKGHFVIAKEGKKPSTCEMYHLLDNSPPLNINVERLVESIENSDLKELAKSFDNAFLSVWENPPLLEKFKDFCPLGTGLSGSGPTCFAFFDAEEKAMSCKTQLESGGTAAFYAIPTKKAIEFLKTE